MFVGKELRKREAQQAGTDKGAALKDVAWIVVQVILWRKKTNKKKTGCFAFGEKTLKVEKTKQSFEENEDKTNEEPWGELQD